MIYHSSLKKEKFTDYDITKDQKNGNYVFVWDINKELSQKLDLLYKKCDIFYSEPTWTDGYNIFLKRANNSNSNFNDYCNSLSNFIINNNKEIILLTGKKMIRKLPKFNSFIEIKVNGYSTVCYGWNIDLGIYKDQCKNNFNLIYCLSKDYKFVGDFCCGYGNTGRIFKENGGNFVMSDINAKCVTYVARNIL